MLEGTVRLGNVGLKLPAHPDCWTVSCHRLQLHNCTLTLWAATQHFFVFAVHCGPVPVSWTLLRTCAEHRIICFIEAFFMASLWDLINSHESDLSVTTWCEGLVSPPCYRCGTETGVLNVCTAWRRQNREGRHSSFQIQEYNTDLSDSKKVSTGFRYTFEHLACLKINFHMEKKQNVQYINYHITNLCCVHV